VKDRPGYLVVVVGVATEIGKTWAAAATARRLRAAGRAVAAWKPAQSFEPGDPDAGVTDAQVLGAATGQPAGAVCPPHRWYEVPMAPPMAAELLGRPPILLDHLVGEVTWPPGMEIGLLEAAGGVRSPLAEDGDAVDLAHRLDPDLVLLVADAGLGTINAVRVSLAPLSPWPVLVLLNRFAVGDELHERNRAWLHERDGVRVVSDVDAVVAALTAPRP
jgi:dethiobiotin synthetase